MLAFLITAEDRFMEGGGLGPGKKKIIECFRPKSRDSWVLKIKSICNLSFHSRIQS